MMNDLGISVVQAAPFGLLVEAPGAHIRLEQLSVEVLRDSAREHHLVLLRGFAGFAEAADLVEYCARWGELMEWPFGYVLDVVEHEGTDEHIFDYSYVPLHWDGMYKRWIPELQFFQCLAAPPGGDGRTTFCNTASVWDHAPPERRALWQQVSATYRIRQVSHYGGVARSPLVEEHPLTGRPILRFNEPARENTRFLNPQVVELGGLPSDQIEELTNDLIARLYAPPHYYEHVWQVGDMIIADNYTLLHGRTGFESRAPRHLRRVHILGSPPRLNPAVPQAATPAE